MKNTLRNEKGLAMYLFVTVERLSNLREDLPKLVKSFIEKHNVVFTELRSGLYKFKWNPQPK